MVWVESKERSSTVSPPNPKPPKPPICPTSWPSNTWGKEWVFKHFPISDEGEVGGQAPRPKWGIWSQHDLSPSSKDLSRAVLKVWIKVQFFKIDWWAKLDKFQKLTLLGKLCVCGQKKALSTLSLDKFMNLRKLVCLHGSMGTNYEYMWHICWPVFVSVWVCLLIICYGFMLACLFSCFFLFEN